MRYSLLIILAFACITGCKKDKYTTEPQISFKEFSTNQGSNHDTQANPPYLIFEITDGEGDIDTDSAKIYFRNTFTNKIDSFHFPDLSTVSGKDFKADVQVSLFQNMGGRLPGGSLQPPYVDTIGFEVYVTDKAKHKSNVIIAAPFYYFRLP